MLAALTATRRATHADRDGADMSVAEFVQKTWDMVNAGHEEVGWSDDGMQIIVFNAERLAASNKLRESSNTTKFESWVRRLNSYGFEKVRGTKPPRWIHPNFSRDRPELLPLVKVQRKEPRGDDEEHHPRTRAVEPPAKRQATASTAGPSSSRARIPAGAAVHAQEADQLLAQELQRNLQEIARAHEELDQAELQDYERRLRAINMMQQVVQQVAMQHVTVAQALGVEPPAAMATELDGSQGRLVPPPVQPPPPPPPLALTKASSTEGSTDGAPKSAAPGALGTADGDDDASGEEDAELRDVISLSELRGERSLEHARTRSQPSRPMVMTSDEPIFAQFLAESLVQLPASAGQLSTADKRLVDTVFLRMEEQLDKVAQAFDHQAAARVLDESARP